MPSWQSEALQIVSGSTGCLLCASMNSKTTRFVPEITAILRDDMNILHGSGSERGTAKDYRCTAKRHSRRNQSIIEQERITNGGQYMRVVVELDDKHSIYEIKQQMELNWVSFVFRLCSNKFVAPPDDYCCPICRRGDLLFSFGMEF